MKFEVRCPACHKGYLIDESSLGGEFWCPACSTPIDMTPPETSPPRDGSSEETGQVIAAAAPSGPAAPTDGPEQVVCPRCRLHFNPFSRAAAEHDSRPRVLIVVEQGFFRKIAEEALAQRCEVETASTIGEAVAILSRGDVNAMILDLDLGDGRQATKLLDSGVGKRCPILVCTARDESELYGDRWSELQKLGADDIVMQDMNAAESLVRKVGNLIGRTWDDEAAHV